MKQSTPAANIVIATIYLCVLVCICYTVKLVLRPNSKKLRSQSKQSTQTKQHKLVKQNNQNKQHKQNKQPRYNLTNIKQALTNRHIYQQCPIIETVAKSYISKYSLVGTVCNSNKYYLLKQILIMSIISVCCCAINWITLWPLAIAIGFGIVGFVSVEVFRVPFVFNTNTKIQQQQNHKYKNNEQNKQVRAQVDMNGEIQPGLVMGVQNNNNYSSAHSNSHKVNDQQQQQQLTQHNPNNITTNLNNINTTNNPNPSIQQAKPIPSSSSCLCSQQQISHEYKYLIFISVMSFIALILYSQTMFTIYNSISNLGALNIGSVAIVIVLDQLLVRPVAGLLLVAIARYYMYVLDTHTNNNNNIQVKNTNKLHIFNILIYKNMCQQYLLQQLNKISNKYPQYDDYQMGASPTRKKILSPSKIPKALVIQSQTLMCLQQTKRVQQQPQYPQIQQKQQNSQQQPKQQQYQQQLPPQQQLPKSPIRHIDELGQMGQSGIFTTIQKQIFNQQDQNSRLGINQSLEIYNNIEKIKVNPNQYFSAQRLPKKQINDQHIEDDGLILVQAGLNMIKQKPNKEKPSTIDVQFSPNKKKKRPLGFNTKKRQLIITGSSPYLQYLPDMMKKQKNKKNITPSNPQIPTVSRKVL